MAELEELVKTFKKKVDVAKTDEKYKNEVITPQVTEVFNREFMEVFRNITETVNQKVNANVINFKPEGKTKFSIEGKFHRIIFQKGKTDVIEHVVSVNIIPICIWKGVTKHLGSISFVKGLETEKVEWDLPAASVEDYTKRLLGNLAEDEDFYM